MVLQKTLDRKARLREEAWLDGNRRRKAVRQNRKLTWTWVNSEEYKQAREKERQELLKTEAVCGNHVYFIEAIGTERCKIGHSSNVEKRLAALQSACPSPLILRATMPGGLTLERELHAKFVTDRVNGEWFILSPEIREFIAGLT